MSLITVAGVLLVVGGLWWGVHAFDEWCYRRVLRRFEDDQRNGT